MYNQCDNCESKASRQHSIIARQILIQVLIAGLKGAIWTSVRCCESNQVEVGLAEAMEEGAKEDYQSNVESGFDGIDDKGVGEDETRV